MWRLIASLEDSGQYDRLCLSLVFLSCIMGVQSHTNALRYLLTGDGCACGQTLIAFVASVLGFRLPVDSMPLMRALAAQGSFLEAATTARPAQMVLPCA